MDWFVGTERGEEPEGVMEEPGLFYLRAGSPIMGMKGGPTPGPMFRRAEPGAVGNLPDDNL